MFGIEGNLPERWRVQHIPAHDLVTLSWTNDFSPLSLWRLLDSKAAIEELNVELLNVNGLLNLVAWTRELNGHLVPHGELPDGFRTAGTNGLVVVRQNSLRALRHEVSTRSNPRRALDPTGQWLRVRKFDDSVFEEDIKAPLYVSEEDLQLGTLRAVYIAGSRLWWVELIAPEGADRRSAYEHFEMLCCWIRKAVPVLEGVYVRLPRGAIGLKFKFANIVGVTEGRPTTASLEALRSAIQVKSQGGSAGVEIEIGDEFDDALAQPENVAEKVLVEAIVTAAATVANEIHDTASIRELVDRICPSSHARWRHRIHAQTFRDFVVSAHDKKPVLIDSMDDALYRVGLGLKAHPNGGEVSGGDECKRCLNDAVREVLDDVCNSLKRFDRRSFVNAVIANHEAAAIDREKWKRTAQANLALHDNSPGAVRTIIRHIGEVNASSLASRVLIEAAICECPMGRGDSPGSLDVSRLMAQIMLAHHFGGWSDAVHWGAMEARIRITPLGDIHMNHAFMDSVYEPFGQTGGESDIQQAVRAYDGLYGPPEAVKSVAELLEPEFLDAWRAEYGVSVDEIRGFLNVLDDAGLKPPRLFYELPRSELTRMIANNAHVSADDAAVAVSTISLRPRSVWRSTEPSMSEKDWYPSRFRRRLSLMRRPLIQLDDGDDPCIIVVPGMVRENLRAIMRAFHRGEIPDSQARSVEMRKWIGRANNIQRTEFNSIVADKMRDLGWQVDKEVKLTKLIGHALDRNYGDVDVLAWRPGSSRVLAIECKDLHYHKTIGEVAEQLSDFRGEIRQDGKPDHLRKHLDRLDVLNTHKEKVVRTLKIVPDVEIEGHLVFRNFVPMQFAWDHMKGKVRLSLFDELDRI